MILQYDSLDTIGNNDEDYGTDEDREDDDPKGVDSDDDVDMHDDPHMEGVEVLHDGTIPIDTEIQVGYAEKKSR